MYSWMISKNEDQLYQRFICNMYIKTVSMIRNVRFKFVKPNIHINARPWRFKDSYFIFFFFIQNCVSNFYIKIWMSLFRSVISFLKTKGFICNHFSLDMHSYFSFTYGNYLIFLSNSYPGIYCSYVWFSFLYSY